MAPEHELLSAKQAGKILKRTAASVRRYTQDGRLPAALKMPGASGAYLYARDAVIAFKDTLESEVVV